MAVPFQAGKYFVDYGFSEHYLVLSHGLRDEFVNVTVIKSFNTFSEIFTSGRYLQC